MKTKIGVIGAGTMGNGIAHVFAQHNYPVILVDINSDFLKESMHKISINMDRQVSKNLFSKD